MKLRAATAALAVALGVWSSGIALAQTPDHVAPEDIPQEDILDLVAPDEILDPTVQSDLPLQGVIDDTVVDESSAELFSADTPPATPSGGRLFALRREVYNASPRKVAMVSAGIMALFGASWLFASAASRRRARRSFRRFPRSSGGSRVRGLEQVVASVQLGRTRPSGRSPMQGSMTGREWRR